MAYSRRKPMKYTKLTMKTTATVTTVLVIILGLYDLVVVVFARKDLITVSDFMVNVGFNAPAVVFMIGFLCGHFFGYMKPVIEEEKK